MSSDLFVQCPCSKQITVSPSQCGSAIQCTCGRTLEIPRLSQLRRDCGQGDKNLSILEKIAGLKNAGLLPPENTCSVCSSVTDDVIECHVQCEVASVTSPSGLVSFISILFLPFMTLAALIAEEHREAEIHGRFTEIDIPVSICKSCKSKFAIKHTRVSSFYYQSLLSFLLLTRD